jgi:hypothetical protein
MRIKHDGSFSSANKLAQALGIDSHVVSGGSRVAT